MLTRADRWTRSRSVSCAFAAAPVSPPLARAACATVPDEVSTLRPSRTARSARRWPSVRPRRGPPLPGPRPAPVPAAWTLEWDELLPVRRSRLHRALTWAPAAPAQPARAPRSRPAGQAPGERSKVRIPQGRSEDRPIGVARQRHAQALGARTLACMTSEQHRVGDGGGGRSGAGLPAVIFLTGLRRPRGLQVQPRARPDARVPERPSSPPGLGAGPHAAWRPSRRSSAGRGCATCPRTRPEGDKTTAFEIAEQLGWEVPECVVDAGTGDQVSSGSGREDSTS